jgi:hypothetical protein
MVVMACSGDFRRAMRFESASVNCCGLEFRSLLKRRLRAIQAEIFAGEMARGRGSPEVRVTAVPQPFL